MKTTNTARNSLIWEFSILHLLVFFVTQKQMSIQPNYKKIKHMFSKLKRKKNVY